MGTACPGSDLLLTVLPLVAEEFFGITGVVLRWKHLLSCEYDLTKCAWIRENFGTEKIFLDVCDMAQPGGSECYLTEEWQEPAPVDIVIAGTSCKDASWMNKLQSEMRDCVELAASTTGSTFRVRAGG